MNSLKSKLISSILALSLVLFQFVLTPTSAFAATFSGGTGTQTDPYIITTTSELQAMSTNLTAFYKLGNDIDLSGVTWTPIGNSTTKFTGGLDGNNHAISNLTINQPSVSYIGLFGYTSGSAKFNNLTLSNVNLSGDKNVGALVANSTNNVVLSNCSVSGNISGTASVGGLVGGGYSVNISNSSSSATITGRPGGSSIGGILGGSTVGNISYCFATGSVTSSNTNTGGLVGSICGDITYSYTTNDVTNNGSSSIQNTGGLLGVQSNSGLIQYCYATGNISSSATNTGGLVGKQHASSSTGEYCTINNSYARGNVRGANTVGGLVGYQYGQTGAFPNVRASIIKSYSTGHVSGTSDVAGFVGDYGCDSGIGPCYDLYNYYDSTNAGGSSSYYANAETTDLMKTQSTYSYWYFTDTTAIWAISTSMNDGYPYLLSNPGASIGPGEAYPQAPSNVQVSGAATKSFTLSFDYNPPSDNVTGYNIFINGSKYGSTVTTSSQIITGLEPNTNYNVWMTAVNSSNLESSPSDIKSIRTTLTDLQTASTPYSVNLVWPAYPGAIKYGISQDGVLIGTTTETSYTVYGLSPGTHYTFTIVINPDTTALTPYDPIDVQTAPQSETVRYPEPAANSSKTTSTSAEVSWDIPQGVDPTTTSYKVYRDGELVGEVAPVYNDSGTPTEWTKTPIKDGVRSQPITETSPKPTFELTDLKPATNYQITTSTVIPGYQAEPRSETPVESQQSAPISITTGTGTGTNNQTGVSKANSTPYSVTLNWPPYPGAIHYTIYQDDVSIGDTTDTTYTITGLEPSKTYTFKIGVTTASGEEFPFDPIVITTDPVNALINGGAPPVVLCSPDLKKYYDPNTKRVKEFSIQEVGNQTDLDKLNTNSFKGRVVVKRPAQAH